MNKFVLFFIVACLAISITCAQDLQTADCGRLYGCIHSKSCTSSANCAFMVMYRQDGPNLKAKVSIREHQWVALGFNKEVASPMIGSLGIICQKLNSSNPVSVFNNSKHSRPQLTVMGTAGLAPGSSRYTNGALICEFEVPIAGNSYLHNIAAKVNSTKLAVASWGQIDQDTQKISYHGSKKYYFGKFDPTSTGTVTISEDDVSSATFIKSSPFVVLVVAAFCSKFFVL